MFLSQQGEKKALINFFAQVNVPSKSFTFSLCLFYAALQREMERGEKVKSTAINPSQKHFTLFFHFPFFFSFVLPFLFSFCDLLSLPALEKKGIFLRGSDSPKNRHSRDIIIRFCSYVMLFSLDSQTQQTEFSSDVCQPLSSKSQSSYTLRSLQAAKSA